MNKKKDFNVDLGFCVFFILFAIFFSWYQYSWVVSHWFWILMVVLVFFAGVVGIIFLINLKLKNKKSKWVRD